MEMPCLTHVIGGFRRTCLRTSWSRFPGRSAWPASLAPGSVHGPSERSILCLLSCLLSDLRSTLNIILLECKVLVRGTRLSALHCFRARRISSGDTCMMLPGMPEL